jgi:hypothetical protein
MPREGLELKKRTISRPAPDGYLEAPMQGKSGFSIKASFFSTKAAGAAINPRLQRSATMQAPRA